MASTTQIWQNFLDIVKQEEGSRVVETWLKAVLLEQWDVRTKSVYLRAPNQFVKEWVCSNYMHLFKEHLSRLFVVDEVSIVFLDMYTEQTSSKQTLSKQVLSGKAEKIVPARLVTNEKKQSTAISRPSKNYTINSTYLFDTFVVGPSNSLSYAAAHAVTRKPGLVYNPLFVYGRSGLGKTHLLHAIGNDIKARYKRLTVLYQPADRFVNEFIHSIRFDKVDLFKEKYRNVDVLLVDDIQFIANKDQTQEAFFHIFNSLYESSKQIVFGSDTYPKDMRGIAERLRSRLEGGLVTDIQRPTLEEKVAILKRKAERSYESIPDDVAHFIASQSIANIRELEGALIRVFAFASLTNQLISLDLVKKVLRRTHVEHLRRIVTLQEVTDCVAKHFSYTLTELRSKSREKDLSFSRQTAMFLMKKCTDKSLQEIGRFLCRKNHTTVVYAVSKIQDLVEQNDQIREMVHSLERTIQSI